MVLKHKQMFQRNLGRQTNPNGVSEASAGETEAAERRLRTGPRAVFRGQEVLLVG